MNTNNTDNLSMQADSDKFRNILKLTELLVQDFLNLNNGQDISYLKEKIRDFLTNELWKNEKLHQLSQEIKDSDLNDEQVNYLWKSMREIFDLYHIQHLNNKSHLFEGKVRVYEKRIIDILIDAGKIQGQNAVLSSIVGYLLLHRNLTQRQLKELTGFSKGAISQTLKILTRTPAIKKEPMEGGREYFYTFGANMVDIATNISSYKSESNEFAINFLQKKLEELKGHKNKIGYEILSKRIIEMKAFFEYNSKLLKKVKESKFIQELKEE